MIGQRLWRNLTLRCGLGARHLPCGCHIGLYETFSRHVVGVLDVRHPSCQDPRHVEDQIVIRELRQTTDPARIVPR